MIYLTIAQAFSFRPSVLACQASQNPHKRSFYSNISLFTYSTSRFANPTAQEHWQQAFLIPANHRQQEQEPPSGRSVQQMALKDSEVLVTIDLLGTSKFQFSRDQA